jgi:chromosome partitioning protein
MAKVASVINFKGGVGKSTLALHFACWLARKGEDAPRVLLVDVDHQSSLSLVCMKSKKWEAAAKSGETVNAIFQSFMGGSLPGLEVISGRPFGDRYPNLDLLPAQMELDDTEIDLAATSIGNPLHSEWNKRTLLCRWLEESGAAQEYDYVVVDCPPATKLVSQNALAASGWYILPVIPEAVSTRGVTHFRNLVKGIDTRLSSYVLSIPAGLQRSEFVPTTDLGGLVISMVRPHGPAASGYVDTHTANMALLRRQWGTDVLKNFIDRAVGVSESLDAGWPVFNRKHSSNVTNKDLPKMFNRVCSELAGRLGW